jgi:hypothetical protein
MHHTRRARHTTPAPGNSAYDMHTLLRAALPLLGAILTIASCQNNESGSGGSAQSASKTDPTAVAMALVELGGFMRSPIPEDNNMFDALLGSMNKAAARIARDRGETTFTATGVRTGDDTTVRVPGIEQTGPLRAAVIADDSTMRAVQQRTSTGRGNPIQDDSTRRISFDSAIVVVLAVAPDPGATPFLAVDDTAHARGDTLVVRATAMMLAQHTSGGYANPFWTTKLFRAPRGAFRVVQIVTGSDGEQTVAMLPIPPRRRVAAP